MCDLGITEAIMLRLFRKRGWFLYFYCLLYVRFLLSFLVPCVGLLQCVIVAFPDHTHYHDKTWSICLHSGYKCLRNRKHKTSPRITSKLFIE